MDSLPVYGFQLSLPKIHISSSTCYADNRRYDDQGDQPRLPVRNLFFSSLLEYRYYFVPFLEVIWPGGRTIHEF